MKYCDFFKWQGTFLTSSVYSVPKFPDVSKFPEIVHIPTEWTEQIRKFPDKKCHLCYISKLPTSSTINPAGVLLI